MDNQENIIHEHKLHSSIVKLLWAFVIVIGLNAVPSKFLIEEANAMTSSEMRSAISYCWDQARIEKQSNGNYKIKTYC
jgi:hypothetical protein